VQIRCRRHPSEEPIVSRSRRPLTTALVSAALALSLSACGGGDPIVDEQPPATDPPPEPALPGDETTPERLEQRDDGEEDVGDGPGGPAADPGAGMDGQEDASAAPLPPARA
jgi:hypothetical protein